MLLKILRLRDSDQRAPDQSAELDHRTEDSSDSRALANRIGFAIGTAVALARIIGEAVSLLRFVASIPLRFL